MSSSIRPTPIPGLLVFEEFVSPEEEAIILSELEGGGTNSSGASRMVGPIPSTLAASASSAPLPTWKTERHSGVHREKRYGADSELWSRTIREPKHPMPGFVNELVLPKIRRALADLAAGWTPNEGNAIEYRRGHSWLKPHVDDRRKHKELIANLSLAGDCYMTFAPATATATASVAAAPAPVPAAANASVPRAECGNSVVPCVMSSPSGTKVLLRRGTLLVLTGKARYEYTHGIDRQDVLSVRRVSFTLRETA